MVACAASARCYPARPGGAYAARDRGIIGAGLSGCPGCPEVAWLRVLPAHADTPHAPEGLTPPGTEE
jgi:hypothetical protein